MTWAPRRVAAREAGLAPASVEPPTDEADGSAPSSPHRRPRRLQACEVRAPKAERAKEQVVILRGGRALVCGEASPGRARASGAGCRRPPGCAAPGRTPLSAPARAGCHHTIGACTARFRSRRADGLPLTPMNPSYAPSVRAFRLPVLPARRCPAAAALLRARNARARAAHRRVHEPAARCEAILGSALAAALAARTATRWPSVFQAPATQRGFTRRPSTSVDASCAACSGVISSPSSPAPSSPSASSSSGVSAWPPGWPSAGAVSMPKRSIAPSIAFGPTRCTAQRAKHWLFEVASAFRMSAWLPRFGGRSPRVSRHGCPRMTSRARLGERSSVRRR